VTQVSRSGGRSPRCLLAIAWLAIAVATTGAALCLFAGGHPGPSGVATRPHFVIAAEEVPTVAFSRSEAPGLAQNFDEALANGAPTRLNRVSAVVRDSNRRAALRGQEPAPAGMSLDEYPFACSAQGGVGACVSAGPVGEQSYQGGVLSSFFQRFGIGEGDPFDVTFVP
jgi:Deoxyribonuclease NucA/NucB